MGLKILRVLALCREKDDDKGNRHLPLRLLSLVPRIYLLHHGPAKVHWRQRHKDCLDHLGPVYVAQPFVPASVFAPSCHPASHRALCASCPPWPATPATLSHHFPPWQVSLYTLSHQTAFSCGYLVDLQILSVPVRSWRSSRYIMHVHHNMGFWVQRCRVSVGLD